MLTALGGTSGGVFFVIVGVVLVYVGYVLLSNHGGAQDRWLAADERRFRLFGKGTSLVAPSRRGARRLGAVVFVLGCAFLIAGFSQL
jgi:hypothetical protein